MEMLFIRHPAPQVAAGICYGSTDLPLQPDALAGVLAQILPVLAKYPRLTPIWSSQLMRARELAQALAQARQQPLYVDADLREMDFGDWEMRAWEDISRQKIDAWAANVCHYHPGGGESVLQMSWRVLSALQRIRQAASEQQASAAILVCHAGCMRIVLALQQMQIQLGQDLSQEQVAQIAQTAVDWPEKIAYGQLCTVLI